MDGQCFACECKDFFKKSGKEFTKLSKDTRNELLSFGYKWTNLDMVTIIQEEIKSLEEIRDNLKCHSSDAAHKV
jgi:hypothetical protein